MKKFAKVLVSAAVVLFLLSFVSCNSDDEPDNSVDNNENENLPETGGGNENTNDPFAGKTFYDEYDVKIVFGNDGTFIKYDIDTDEGTEIDEPQDLYRYSIDDEKLYVTLFANYFSGFYDVEWLSYDVISNNFDTFWETYETGIRENIEKYEENNMAGALAFSVGLPPTSDAETVIQKLKNMRLPVIKLMMSQVHTYSYKENVSGYALKELITDKNGIEMAVFQDDFSNSSDYIHMCGSYATDCLQFEAFISGVNYQGFMDDSKITFYVVNEDSLTEKYTYTYIGTVNYTVTADVANNKKTMKFKFNDKNYELVYKPETTTFYSERQNND